VSGRRTNRAPEITPLGDGAVIIRTGPDDAAPDARLIDGALAALDRINHAAIRGVSEVTTAYATVAVYYDPIEIDRLAGENVIDALTRQLTEALAHGARGQKNRGRLVEIPVCYDPEFGPDLIEVAQYTGLTPNEIVARHSRARYRVACIGFTPGFPYLLGLPPELATPRRASPRTLVPAGSVGIGGSQTGIYPQQSPGGWNIIGRTSLRLFDPGADSASLLRPGDLVRFRPVSKEQLASPFLPEGP
jgi:inhibitor of KinA